jgi:hypothetical protein
MNNGYNHEKKGECKQINIGDKNLNEVAQILFSSLMFFKNQDYNFKI